MTYFRAILLSCVLVLTGSAAGAVSADFARSQPILECSESCQQFNAFGDCVYRTGCRLESGCMVSISCGHFDAYGETCEEERTRRVCAVPSCPGAPLPAPQFPIVCEETCQKRGAFGRCVYMTRCEIVGRCRHETICQRFNSFGDQCISEQTSHSCY